MSDYIVKDTELTSVANAIRIKGGTNSQLVFPNGFVSAIGNISGGGGSSDFSTAEVTLNLVPPEGITFIETALENLRTEYPNEDFSYICNYLPSINNKCSVLLYKGRAIVDGVKGTTENYSDYGVIIGTPITTGGVTWNSENNIFEITGDGTITASVSDS